MELFSPLSIFIFSLLPLDSFAVSSSSDDCNVINLALTLLWHYGIKIQEETGQEDKNTRRETPEIRNSLFDLFVYSA